MIDQRPHMSRLISHAPEFAPEAIFATRQRIHAKGFRGIDAVRKMTDHRNRVAACYVVAASIAIEFDRSETAYQKAFLRRARRRWRRAMIAKRGPINFRWLLAASRDQLRRLREWNPAA